MRHEKEFEEYTMSLTPCPMEAVDPSALPSSKTRYMSTTERFQQRNSSQPPPINLGSSPEPRSSRYELDSPSRSTSSKPTPTVSELLKRIETLHECQSRKFSLLRQDQIEILEGGVKVLRAGGTWVEPVDEDDY